MFIIIINQENTSKKNVPIYPRLSTRDSLVSSGSPGCSLSPSPRSLLLTTSRQDTSASLSSPWYSKDSKIWRKSSLSFRQFYHQPFQGQASWLVGFETCVRLLQFFGLLLSLGELSSVFTLDSKLVLLLFWFGKNIGQLRLGSCGELCKLFSNMYLKIKNDTNMLDIQTYLLRISTDVGHLGLII